MVKLQIEQEPEKKALELLIHFNNPQLAATCCSPVLATKHHLGYGNSLINRMSELRCAPTLADIPTVPPPRCRKLSDHPPRWAINLTGGYRLIIEPSGEFGTNDPNTISEVTIIEITNLK